MTNKYLNIALLTATALVASACAPIPQNHTANNMAYPQASYPPAHYAANTQLPNYHPPIIQPDYQIPPTINYQPQQPQTHTNAGTNPPATVVQGNYVVQLTASSDSRKADGIRGQFASYGYSTLVAPVNASGQQLYRVQVGPFGSEAEAQNMLAQLRQRYPGNPYVSGAIVRTR